MSGTGRPVAGPGSARVGEGNRMWKRGLQRKGEVGLRERSSGDCKLRSLVCSWTICGNLCLFLGCACGKESGREEKATKDVAMTFRKSSLDGCCLEHGRTRVKVTLRRGGRNVLEAVSCLPISHLASC